MNESFLLELEQMHPGVPDMDAVYQFICTYNGKQYRNNASDVMFLLSTDCKEVTVNGLEVIVPYSVRQTSKTVSVTAVLNDYVNEKNGEQRYDIEFNTVFSDAPTFFDDFETFDSDKWKSGAEGWEYGDLPAPYVENSNIVFEATTPENPYRIVTTARSFQQAFGCFSAKIKMPECKNTACSCNMAFWLASNVMEPDTIMFKRNPDVKDPFGCSHAGEIDICEYSGAFGDYTAMTYHYYGWSEHHKQTGQCVHTPNVRNGYHIFSLVWEPGALYWYYDGRLCRVVNGEEVQGAGQEPGGEMVVLLQSGGTRPHSGFQGNWTGITDSKDFPMEMRVDWVKVHALI